MLIMDGSSLHDKVRHIRTRWKTRRSRSPLVPPLLPLKDSGTRRSSIELSKPTEPSIHVRGSWDDAFDQAVSLAGLDLMLRFSSYVTHHAMTTLITGNMIQRLRLLHH